MNPDERDSALATATAAARRLLVKAIDVRFSLDEIAAGMTDGNVLTPDDLRALRVDADILRHEIECVREALWPPTESEERPAEAEELPEETSSGRFW